MIGRGHFGINRGDFAVRADEDGNAARSGRFVRGGAIGFRHRHVRIAEKVIREVEFFLKRAIIGGAVCAAPQNDRVLALEILDSITEPVAFDRSTGGIGLRIPPNQNVFSRMVGERNGFARLIRNAEGRGLITNFDHGLNSLFAKLSV